MFKVNVVFDAKKVSSEYRSRFASAKTALDATVLKSCEEFVPYDTGALMRSGKALSGGGVVYEAPYAKRMYYHDGNFSKKVHKSAGGAWFERAKAENLPAWLDEVRERVSR